MERPTNNQLEKDIIYLDSKVTELMKKLKDHMQDENAHKV